MPLPSMACSCCIHPMSRHHREPPAKLEKSILDLHPKKKKEAGPSMVSWPYEILWSSTATYCVNKEHYNLEIYLAIYAQWIMDICSSMLSIFFYFQKERMNNVSTPTTVMSFRCCLSHEIWPLLRRIKKEKKKRETNGATLYNACGPWGAR